MNKETMKILKLSAILELRKLTGLTYSEYMRLTSEQKNKLNKKYQINPYKKVYTLNK